MPGCGMGPLYLNPRDVSEAAVFVDLSGSILGTSPAFEILFGWRERELIGQSFFTLFNSSLDNETEPRRIKSTLSLPIDRLAGTHLYRCRDSRLFRGKTTILPLRGEDDSVECYIIIIDNRSDGVFSSDKTVSLYQEIGAPVRPGANVEDLERFAQIASHDLQEPLRRIITYCDILKEDHGSELSDEASEIAGVIQSGGRRLRLIINDLLTYVRVREQLDRAFEPVDMSAVLYHAMDEMHDEIASRKVRVDAAHLPLVWGRAPLFRTVFRHLLGNAIKYSGERSPVIDIAIEDVGDIWQFAVADRGLGVESRFADRIFEIFQRLHDKDEREGSGAGLAICRLIIERCGGEIWLDRSYDRGARFLFTLPKGKPEASGRA